VGGEVVVVDGDGGDVVPHCFAIAHPDPHRLNAGFGDVKPHQPIRLGGAEGRQIHGHPLGGTPFGAKQHRLGVKTILK
jgi:hypothetical protein